MGPSPGDSWWHYLTSDSQVTGIVTWLSFFATLIGFGIGIVQLRKVKAASYAAATAVKDAQRMMRAHDQNAKISASLEYITSANAQIQRENSDAAGAYLAIAWNVLVEARAITTAQADSEEIGDYVRQVKRLVDEIRAPMFEQQVSRQLLYERHLAISHVLTGLGAFAAKVRVNLAGVGVGGRDERA